MKASLTTQTKSCSDDRPATRRLAAKLGVSPAELSEALAEVVPGLLANLVKLQQRIQ